MPLVFRINYMYALILDGAFSAFGFARFAGSLEHFSVCSTRARFLIRIRDELEFEDEYDWGTIARNEKRANEHPISWKSLPRLFRNRFRSSIVIVLELVLVLEFRGCLARREFA